MRNWFSLPRSRYVGTDPRSVLLERARRDERMLSVVTFLDREAELRAGGQLPPTAADGNFFVDSRTPFMTADQTQITGTGEALLWPLQYSMLPADYFWIGKMVYFMASGKMSSASSTPGNLTLTMRYGTTTGGTAIATSAATAFATSKSNINFIVEGWVVCRGVGTSGSVAATGRFMFDGAGGLFSTTSQNPLLFPATSPGAGVTIDTTTAQGIVLGVTMGSASDLATCSYLQFQALN